jgi:DNA polymerase-3 subunit epsilon
LFAIIDIETTGHSRKGGKITEIAIFVHNGFEITDSFTSLINPECYIPGFITNLTGIDNEMVRNAPKFYEIARKIVEMTEGKIFVAHHVSFDYRFVQEEFKQLGYDFRRKTMCTVRMSRKYLPGHRSYSLGNLCSELNISINGRHRAAGDALATVKLFELIMARKTLNETKLSPEQLRLF